MNLDRPTIARLLRDSRVPAAEPLAALAEPSWRVTAHRTELSELALGASRFGGSPDVPDAFAWPMHRGRPISFLAQFELSSLAAAWPHQPLLPSSGWLLFFYDVAEQPWGFDPIHRGGAAAIYLDVDRNALRRTEHPDVTSAGGPFDCCELSLVASLVLPDWGDRLLGAHGFDSAETLANGYVTIADTLRNHDACAGPRHRLLGHPRLIQGDMRGPCQLVTHGIYCGDPRGFEGKRASELLESAASQWHLLLELDTDTAGPGWEWGDCGRVYFWIRRQDLAERAFDKIWLILQSN